MAESRRVVVVSATPVEVAAARVVAALARFASPRLAVAGGSALAVLGQVRRTLPAGAWRALRLTWVDERCVPLASSESNRGLAWRAGHLDAADPPALELPLYLDGEDLASACARVQRALAAEFAGGLDVLLLGMGPDGHIASLFPGGPTASTGDLVMPVRSSPKAPAQRITLTLDFLRTVPAAVLLAVGESKRVALMRLVRGDPELAASALAALVVVTDLDLGERA